MNLVKLQDTKLTYRNQLHLYTLTTNSLKELLRNNPIYNNKIFRNKFDQDEYPENCKTLMTQIEQDTNKWKNIPCP